MCGSVLSWQRVDILQRFCRALHIMPPKCLLISDSYVQEYRRPYENQILPFPSPSATILFVPCTCSDPRPTSTSAEEERVAQLSLPTTFVAWIYYWWAPLRGRHIRQPDRLCLLSVTQIGAWGLVRENDERCRLFSEVKQNEPLILSSIICIPTHP